MLSPVNGTLEFRTVFAGVRPARIAVLVEKDDPDWQETCRRIIECLGAIWGGRHSVIVPTNGESIEPAFWDILEAFDPDYVAHYQKTGRDLRISRPAEFEQEVTRIASSVSV